MSKLANGWHLMEEKSPPLKTKILVTNNLKALYADGERSHIFLAQFLDKASIKKKEAYDPWEVGRTIHGVQAWFLIPEWKKAGEDNES